MASWDEFRQLLQFQHFQQQQPQLPELAANGRSASTAAYAFPGHTQDYTGMMAFAPPQDMAPSSAMGSAYMGSTTPVAAAGIAYSAHPTLEASSPHWMQEMLSMSMWPDAQHDGFWRQLPSGDMETGAWPWQDAGVGQDGKGHAAPWVMHQHTGARQWDVPSSSLQLAADTVSSGPALQPRPPQAADAKKCAAHQSLSRQFDRQPCSPKGSEQLADEDAVSDRERFDELADECGKTKTPSDDGLGQEISKAVADFLSGQRGHSLDSEDEYDAYEHSEAAEEKNTAAVDQEAYAQGMMASAEFLSSPHSSNRLQLPRGQSGRASAFGEEDVRIAAVHTSANAEEDVRVAAVRTRADTEAQQSRESNASESGASGPESAVCDDDTRQVEAELLDPRLERGRALGSSLCSIPLPAEATGVTLPHLHCLITSCISGLYRERLKPTIPAVQQKLRERGMAEVLVQVLLLLCAREPARYGIWLQSDMQICLVLMDEPLEDANLDRDSFDYSPDFLEAVVQKCNERFASKFELSSTIGEHTPPCAPVVPTDASSVSLVADSCAPGRALAAASAQTPELAKPSGGIAQVATGPSLQAAATRACSRGPMEDGGATGVPGGDSEPGAESRTASGKKPKTTRAEALSASAASSKIDKAHAEALAVMLQQQGVTTLMLRNLPHNVTQKRLVEELANSGFAGLYDFCYMPSTFGTGVGKGYAFVNLTSPAALSAFVLTWHSSRRFAVCAADSVLNVSAAALQGREENARKWDAPRMRRVRNPALRPLVIGPWDGRPEVDYDGNIIGSETASKSSIGPQGGGGAQNGGAHGTRSRSAKNNSQSVGPPLPPSVPAAPPAALPPGVIPPPGLMPVGPVPALRPAPRPRADGANF